MTEQRHHNRNPKKVMAQEQKKTSKNTNSRRRGSARGRNANGSNSRTPSRKINATRQATAPQQDAVLIAPPKYRKGSMRITPLGGLGEIGRNMNVIEYNGHLLLIDCGVLFPEEEQPGVDLILPDFSYIKNRLDKVDALVLTHGHEDHIEMCIRDRNRTRNNASKHWCRPALPNRIHQRMNGRLWCVSTAIRWPMRYSCQTYCYAATW